MKRFVCMCVRVCLNVKPAKCIKNFLPLEEISIIRQLSRKLQICSTYHPLNFSVALHFCLFNLLFAALYFEFLERLSFRNDSKSRENVELKHICAQRLNRCATMTMYVHTNICDSVLTSITAILTCSLLCEMIKLNSTELCIFQYHFRSLPVRTQIHTGFDCTSFLQCWIINSISNVHRFAYNA